MPPSWQVGPWADATAPGRPIGPHGSSRARIYYYVVERRTRARVRSRPLVFHGNPVGGVPARARLSRLLSPTCAPRRCRHGGVVVSLCPRGALSYCHAGSLDPLQRTSAREENNHEMVQKKKRSCLYEGMIPTVAKLHV